MVCQLNADKMERTNFLSTFCILIVKMKPSKNVLNSCTVIRTSKEG